MNRYYQSRQEAGSVSRRFILIVTLLLLVGIAGFRLLQTQLTEEATITEAEVDQVITTQLSRNLDESKARGYTAANNTIIVKVQPHLTDAAYNWYEQSPLAIWKYSSGSLLTASSADLAHVKDAGSGHITFYSVQATSATMISVTVADFYWIESTSPGFTQGGAESHWQLTNSDAGWQLTKNETVLNWDG